MWSVRLPCPWKLCRPVRKSHPGRTGLIRFPLQFRLGVVGFDSGGGFLAHEVAFELQLAIARPISFGAQVIEGERDAATTLR